MNLSQKILLLVGLLLCISRNIIDRTTSTLGRVLESGRSIGKRLSNTTSDVANDTSDGVDSAYYNLLVCCYCWG